MITDTPLIWQFEVSPYAAKVRRVLHYKGVTFDVQNLNASDLKKTRAVSPTGKTPVLDHDGQRIVDSTDIVEYLDKTFADNRPVIPSDPKEKAQAAIIEDWADESLYFYDLSMRIWPQNRELLLEDLTKDEKPWMKRLFRPLLTSALKGATQKQGLGRKTPEDLTREIRKLFEAVDVMVANDSWLVGRTISIADISVVSMLTVLERAKEARSIMETLPNLMAWRDRVDTLTLPPGTKPEDKAVRVKKEEPTRLLSLFCFVRRKLMPRGQPSHLQFYH